MKLLPAFAAAALAAVSFGAVAAPAGYVSYRCDSGKNLTVMAMLSALMSMQPALKQTCVLTEIVPTIPVRLLETNAVM